MKRARFRVIVATRTLVPLPAHFYPVTSYVAKVQRRFATGDPFKATATTTDRLTAATFTYNVARAVATRNHGILETV